MEIGNTWVEIAEGACILQKPGTKILKLTYSTLAPNGNDETFLLRNAVATRYPAIHGKSLWAMSPQGIINLSVEAEEDVLGPGSPDDAGKIAFNTIFGDAVVDSRVDDISINFNYGLSTSHDVIDKSTGTGSIGSAGSDARVSLGLGVGEGSFYSKNAIRYRAGHEAFSLFTFDISGSEVGVNSYVGILNDEDSFSLGYKDTDFGIWYIENGNKVHIPQSAGQELDHKDALTQFNVDPLDGSGLSGFTLDPTKRNLFCVTYGYLGIAPAVFRVYAGIDKGWVVCHIIDLTNFQIEGHLKNPILPLGMKVERIAGAGADITITTGSWNAGTVGGGTVADRWAYVEEVRVNLPSKDIATNPNLYENMFTLLNKATFNGKVNHIRVELAVANFTTDANKSVEFVIVRNGTLLGNTVYDDLEAGNSVLEVSREGTVEGPVAGAGTTLAKISDRRTDVKGTNIYIRAGEYITLGARGVGGAAVTGDIIASFRLIQEF